MAGLKEFYCRSNETSLGSQFKWLEYPFKEVFRGDIHGLKAGLRIRIHFIRIQHFRLNNNPDPIHIQGFNH